MTGIHLQPLAEHHLLAAGWRNPAELSRVCDALHLRYLDFGDRLVGVVVGYLRSCADRGVPPDLDECEQLLTTKAVPRDPGELYHILQDPTAGESITDLALAVQRGADERTDALCRALTRDALKAVSHTFTCPDCIRCSQAKPSGPRPRMPASRADKAWRLRYEPSNANG
ncbi:MAG: hypothetical protein V1790_05980 [Planctomycetota bacterium]